METLLNQTLNRVGELESSFKKGMEEKPQDVPHKVNKVNKGDETPRTVVPSDTGDENGESDASGSDEEPNYIVTPSGHRVPLMPF